MTVREALYAEAEMMLLEKNAAYGDSARNPVRITSNATTIEQLLVRIDDKLSRIMRGKRAGEDTTKDLIGYIYFWIDSLDGAASGIQAMCSKIATHMREMPRAELHVFSGNLRSQDRAFAVVDHILQGIRGSAVVTSSQLYELLDQLYVIWEAERTTKISVSNIPPPKPPSGIARKASRGTRG